MDYIDEHLVPPSLRTAIQALPTRKSSVTWKPDHTEKRFDIHQRHVIWREEGYIANAGTRLGGAYEVKTTAGQYYGAIVRPEDITALVPANKRDGKEPIWIHPSYTQDSDGKIIKTKPDIHDAVIALLNGDDFAEFGDDSYPVDHILFEHRKF